MMPHEYSIVFCISLDHHFWLSFKPELAIYRKASAQGLKRALYRFSQPQNRRCFKANLGSLTLHATVVGLSAQLCVLLKAVFLF